MGNELQGSLTSLLTSSNRQPEKSDRKLVSAPKPQAISGHEKDILNIFSEGVFVVDCAWGEDDFTLVFANKALANFTQRIQDQLEGLSLSQVFSEDRHPELYETMARVCLSHQQESVEISLGHGEKSRTLRITLTALEKEADHHEIVGCAIDITDLLTRNDYLTERTIELVDRTNVLESSRRDLEKEVLRLRGRIKDYQRAEKHDRATGLPNRSYFLERTSEEFQRSIRYDHKLSVVVAGIQGYEHISANRGLEAWDGVMMGLGQICETVSRNGVDIIGRTGIDQIGIMLPETGLPGGLQYLDRVRALIAETPLKLGDGQVRLGLRASVDSLQSEDTSFAQMLARASAAMTPKPTSKS